MLSVRAVLALFLMGFWSPVARALCGGSVIAGSSRVY